MAVDKQLTTSELISAAQAARLLGIEPTTLQKWQQRQILQPVLTEADQPFYAINDVVVLQKQLWQAELIAAEPKARQEATGPHQIRQAHENQPKAEAIAMLENYAELLKLADEGMWIIDAQGETSFANRKMAEMLGCTSEELANSTLFDFMDEAGRMQAPAQLELHIAGREKPREIKFQRKDGNEVWAVITTKPLFNEAGQYVGSVGVFSDITARKRTEDTLRESDARFETMANNAPVLLWMSGTDTLCHFFNKPWLDFTGRTLEQEMDNGWAEGVHPDDLQSCLDTYLSAFEARQEFVMEYRLRRFDGEYRWVVDTGRPLFTPAGVFSGYIGSCLDITERKRTEEATRFLAEANALMNWSLDYSTTLTNVARLSVPFLADICTIDLVEPDNSLHRVAVAHFDPAKEVTLRASIGNYPYDPTRPNLLFRIQRTGRAERTNSVSRELVENYALDDRQLKLMDELGPHRSMMAVPLVARGRTLGIISLGTTTSGRVYSEQDLALAEDLARRAALAMDNARLYEAAQAAIQEQATARRELESVSSLLAQRANELDAIIEAMPDGLFVCDVANHFVRMNPKAAEIFGLTVEEAMQPEQHLSQINQSMFHLDGGLLRLDELPLSLALGGKTGTDYRLTIRRPGHESEIYVQVSYAPIRGSQGEIVGAVAVASDITALHRLEQQKDEFLGIASHELKTPITAIKGVTQLAVRRLNRAGHVQDALSLQNLDKQINRLTALVDALLNVSRLQTGKLEAHFTRFDFADLVQLVVEAMQATTDRHNLRLVSPVSLELIGDSHQIEQVLTNLLANAVKYSPDGGSIEVTLEQIEQEAYLSVRDSGIGIPEGERGQLFERFHRASNAAEHSITGFGIGLFISQEIVRRHNGRIWLAETDQPGTTFCVALPLAPEQSTLS